MFKNRTGRPVYMATVALAGWFALVLQLGLMLTNTGATNSQVGRLVNFFSFFTILSNILVAVSFTVQLVSPVSRPGKFFSGPSVSSAIAVYIAVVGITYSLVLRKLWHPQGWQLVADTLLHDVIPVLYVLYWFIFVPKGRLQWTDAGWWLLFPLVYIVYTLLRGAISDWYPYPFVDVNVLGYSRVTVSVLVLSGVFLGMGLLAVWLDGLLKNRKN